MRNTRFEPRLSWLRTFAANAGIILRNKARPLSVHIITVHHPLSSTYPYTTIALYLIQHRELSSRVGLCGCIVYRGTDAFTGTQTNDKVNNYKMTGSMILHTFRNRIWVIKSRKIRWVRHLARIVTHSAPVWRSAARSHRNPSAAVLVTAFALASVAADKSRCHTASLSLCHQFESHIGK